MNDDDIPDPTVVDPSPDPVGDGVHCSSCGEIIDDAGACACTEKIG